MHAYEAMECIGGSGVMEDSPMPRLYREGPVNAIWEGSGNVQCLDVMRAMQKSPETLEAYFAEVGAARGESAALDAPCRGAEGRSARHQRFRGARPRFLRPAGAGPAGERRWCGRARRRRRRLLPRAAGEPRRPSLRRAAARASTRRRSSSARRRDCSRARRARPGTAAAAIVNPLGRHPENEALYDGRAQRARLHLHTAEREAATVAGS